MELHDISLVRGDRLIFEGLSLRLPEKRIGLIGPNGSGKSSLLRLLKGLLAPNAGTVRRRDRVGFVFQNPDHQLLFPTVLEELCFGRTERGEPPEEAKNFAEALLAQHSYSFLADKATHELSDGQKQLLCIFSVLADGAEVILFDEPCASLDLATTNAISRLIHSLSQQVVLATHDLRLLENFERVIWLESGKVKMDAPASQVLPAYESAYAAVPIGAQA
jgi:biotin transport system ATP-binding protein